MLTGYMRQYAPNGIPSLLDLAVRYRQSGAFPSLLDVGVQVPGTSIKLISGIRNHNQASAINEIWRALTEHAQKLDAAGIDVVIDIGRLGLSGSPTSLINTAELTLLVTRSTLPALVPAKNWATVLNDTVGPESGRAGLLLVGPGQPYSATDVAAQLRLPVIATLPTDPTTAQVFSHGSTPGRRFERSPLYKALPPTVAAIHKHIIQARVRLGTGEGELA